MSSKIKFIDVGGIDCPRCGKLFRSAVRTNATTPELLAGHRGICGHCEAFILIVQDGLLLKAVQEQESDLPPEIREKIPTIRENNRRIREYYAMCNAFEGIL
jgi:hypothetical protein